MTKMHDGAFGSTEGIVETELHGEELEVPEEELGRHCPAAGKKLGAGTGAQGVEAECEVIVAPKGTDGSTDNFVDARDGSSEHLGAGDARCRSGGAELVSMESGALHDRS